jgi:hypothetical protein
MKLEQFYGYESDEDPRGISDTSPWFNPWKISLNATLSALVLSIIALILYLLLPFPFFHNFSSGSDWMVVPLRLTSVSYERFYEGFSLEGEVWNQTKEQPLELRARIKVIGTDDKPIDVFDVEVAPSPLEPGEAGEFEARYTENSPFIKGYQISFVTRDGSQIPHLTGFDVE